jgi:hypothetical protein
LSKIDTFTCFFGIFGLFLRCFWVFFAFFIPLFACFQPALYRQLLNLAHKNGDTILPVFTGVHGVHAVT